MSCENITKLGHISFLKQYVETLLRKPKTMQYFWQLINIQNL